MNYDYLTALSMHLLHNLWIVTCQVEAKLDQFFQEEEKQGDPSTEIIHPTASSCQLHLTQSSQGLTSTHFKDDFNTS